MISTISIFAGCKDWRNGAFQNFTVASLSLTALDLSVSCKNESRAVTKNALSLFLRETIKEAYVAFSPDQPWREDSRAHSIRTVATSLNIRKSHSLKTILEAATWRGNSIFASHYLKDVKPTFKYCPSLGPVIVSGGAV